MEGSAALHPLRRRLLSSASQAVNPATAKVEGPSTPALELPRYAKVYSTSIVFFGEAQVGIFLSEGKAIL